MMMSCGPSAPAPAPPTLTDFEQRQIQPRNLPILAKDLLQMSLLHILRQATDDNHAVRPRTTSACRGSNNIGRAVQSVLPRRPGTGA